ncbi:MAG: hypothetical protein LAO78_25005 [Acidobacteriia bacterium]|nr:hypothetical protein [Terriglobia bacterium]
MKNAIVLALLLMRMVAEEIVKDAAAQEEGRIESKFIGIWNLVLGLTVPNFDSAKYQVPRPRVLVVA